jgi:uncharacterized protein
VLGNFKAQPYDLNPKPKETYMDANDIFEIAVPQFTRTLTALKGSLKKAAMHADQKKFDVNTFFEMRLAPDQFHLGRQIQIATDNAKGFAFRLSGKTAPVFEDKEKTYQEFDQRLDKTIQLLAQFKPGDFEGWQSKRISFPWYPGKELGAKDYVITHALPNFYFHTAMAYAILRENGVDLGKADFLGQQPWISQ